MSTSAPDPRRSFHDGRDPLPSDPPEADDVRARVDSSVRPRMTALIAAGEYSLASDLVRENWFDLLLSIDEQMGLEIERMPAAALREHPLLMMLLGLIYNVVPHRRVKGLRYFVGAARAARTVRRDIDPVDRALILASESAAYRLIGRPSLGVKPARAAVRALDGLTGADRQSVQALSRVYSHVGTTLYYADQVDDALDTFEKGLAESPETGYSPGFGNLAMLAGIHALRGDLSESEAYLELARDGEWTAMQKSWYPGTFYRVAEAVVALERFDAVEAREQLSAMVHDRRTIEHWIAIARVEAMTELVAGRPAVALAELDSFAAMRASEGRSPTARAALAPTRAMLQLALGNPDAADVIVRRDVPAGPARHLAKARVELVLGHHGAALQELRNVKGSAPTSRAAAEALALEAAALLRFSERTRARAAVEQLGAVLERNGQRLVLALLPPRDVERLLGALAEAGYGHLTDGLDVTSLLADADPGTVLSERELAVLRALERTPSVSAMAAELVVSTNTVKTQLRSVYRKLGVTSRDEAIAVAIARHLLVPKERE
ncbi:response regulator transcription factor [Leifsonia sp. NPDC058292]|uniref:helix-turn-helix transcriptional regulator n=1 Tax=Leifsonia sp. NPDC058292 TaxID=3346428 RepID=UPI0036D83DAE